MYHGVAFHDRDALTVSRSMLQQQLAFLARHRCTTVHVQDLLDHGSTACDWVPRPVLLTFDDGRADFYTYAYPLLQALRMKAVVFLVAGRIGGTNQWDGGNIPLLGRDQIKEMAASGLVEFGFHSFDHASYTNLSIPQIREDVRKCRSTLEALEIPHVPALAYPYGAFPRSPEGNAGMRRVFREEGLRCAFRIGQRVNRLPIHDPYELTRAGIGGGDSMLTFAAKLLLGRNKPFA